MSGNIFLIWQVAAEAEPIEPFDRGIRFLVGGKEIHVHDETHGIPVGLMEEVINGFIGEARDRCEQLEGVQTLNAGSDWAHSMATISPDDSTRTVHFKNHWGPNGMFSADLVDEAMASMDEEEATASLTPRTQDDFIEEILAYPPEAWREEFALDIEGQPLAVYKFRNLHLDFFPLPCEQDDYLDALATARVHHKVAVMKKLTDEMNYHAVSGIILPERHQHR